MNQSFLDVIKDTIVCVGVTFHELQGKIPSANLRIFTNYFINFIVFQFNSLKFIDWVQNRIQFIQIE